MNIEGPRTGQPVASRATPSPAASRLRFFPRPSRDSRSSVEGSARGHRCRAKMDVIVRKRRSATASFRVSVVGRSTRASPSTRGFAMTEPGVGGARHLSTSGGETSATNRASENVWFDRRGSVEKRPRNSICVHQGYPGFRPIDLPTARPGSARMHIGSVMKASVHGCSGDRWRRGFWRLCRGGS
jgi:hypothetical protein